MSSSPAASDTDYKNGPVPNPFQRLPDSVLIHVGRYLGMSSKLSAIRSCRQARRLLQPCLTYYQDNFKGSLPLESGQRLSFALDLLRWSTIGLRLHKPSAAAIRLGVNQGPHNIHLLRGSSQDTMSELVEMNYKMYSYWDFDTSGKTNSGVLNFARQCAEENGLTEMSAVLQSIKDWSSTRVYGTFYVLLDRPDGTILVSEDSKRVYLVHGITQSLAEPLLTMMSLPVSIQTTIFPFEGYLAYDGLFMMGNQDISPARRRTLFKAYLDAAERGAIVVGTNDNCFTGPLSNAKKRVSKSSAASRTASRVSYNIPALAQEHEALLLRLTRVPRFSKREAAGFWVVRRLDCTPASNPQNVYSLFCGSGQLLHSGQFQKLVPTVPELMRVLQACVFRGESAQHRAPFCFSVDALECVEPLQQLLESTGIGVAYYAPPSAEEQGIMHAAQQIGCQVCHVTADVTGRPLFKCSRCQTARYCSAEHQRADWKVHKLTCKSSQ